MATPNPRLKPRDAVEPAPVEKKAPPIDIVVPRLTPEVARKRAEDGYDKAVAILIKERFSKPPSKEEMALLNSMLQDQKYRTYAENGRDYTIDLDQIMKDIAQKHPDYLLARYYEVATDFSWIASGSKVKFNAAALARNMRENYLAGLRSAVIQIIVQFAEFHSHAGSIDVKGFPPDIMLFFATSLSTSYTGKDSLPLVLAYGQSLEEPLKELSEKQLKELPDDLRRIFFKSRFEPPIKIIDVQEDEIDG